MNCNLALISFFLLVATCILNNVEAVKTIECKAGSVGTCIKCPGKDGTLAECAVACRSYGLAMTTCKLDKPAAGQKPEDVKAHCDCDEKVDLSKLPADGKKSGNTKPKP